MSLPITGVGGGLQGLLQSGVGKAGGSPGGASGAAGMDDFSARLDAALEKVDDQVQGADASLQALATGQETNLHQTMIALQEADIAVRTMTSVRDKVVGAYEQIMNMAI
jgi:flagellar hook-basal body complex protein FliE